MLVRTTTNQSIVSLMIKGEMRVLSIGEFSKICGVTKKTLRHYDEIGLLAPSVTSPSTGYRYYATAQLHTMLLISRMKGYGFSLDEIRGILETLEAEKSIADLLTRQQERLMLKRENLDTTLSSIGQDIENMKRGIAIMSYLDDIQVHVVETTPTNILFLRQTISTEQYGMYIGKLYERIAAEHLTPLSGPICFYHCEDFNPEASDVEFAIAIKETVEGTRTMPAAHCAKVVHKGPYSELKSAYAKLTEWTEQEGYEITGAPYEIYMNHPSQVHPNDLITEIYFPIRKK